MVFNPHYDLSRPLASALRAKAPYVGIPIPGHAPLIFNRLFLWRALKGVKPVNVEVQVYENCERLLIVDGIAEEHWNGKVLMGRVRHHMKARSLRRDRWQDKQVIESAMEKWKPAIAVKGSPAPKKAPRSAAREAAIARLERQLMKLGSRPTIQNPATYDNRYEPNAAERERITRVWTQWFNQKALRGKVGALAKVTPPARELYAGLRALGLANVRTFSELHVDEKRSLAVLDEEDRQRGGGYGREGTYFDFARPKNLWRFQPELHAPYRSYAYRSSRPEIYGTDGNDPQYWGAERYNCILEWSRARREIESQIEGIRQLSADSGQ